MTTVLESLYAWTAENHRQPAGGIRSVLLRNPASADGPDGQ